jgi:hypothetical protein
LIQVTRETNKEKVAIVAHSMGNRNVQYFLNWVKKNHGQQWIDDNIGKYIALAAPFLGAPKAVRGSITGDKFGLDLFINDEESIRLCRKMGSGKQTHSATNLFSIAPWLFPIRHDLFNRPHFAYIRNDEGDSFRPTAGFDLLPPSGAQEIMTTFQTHYLLDPLMYKENANFEDTDHPIMEAPPVKELVCIYGMSSISFNTKVR